MTGMTLDTDAATIAAWARVVDDHNPLHVDPEFARRTRFGGPIVHGSLLFALVCDAVQAAGRGATVSVRFRQPVPVGSRVTVDVSGAVPRLIVNGREPVEVSTGGEDR